MLDVIGQAIVEVVPKGTFSVSSDLQSNSIELNNILHSSLTILYGEVIKLVLGISDAAVWAKVDLEFKDKAFEIIHP